MTEIEKLKLEIKALKHKLGIASDWMKREIKNQVQKVSKERIQKLNIQVKTLYKKENIDKKISDKINKFFGDIMLLNVPDSIIKNIISGEILYYNLKQNKETDGLSVIISYHKALDTMIESFITKGFRKFAKKDKNLYKIKNDPLEKSLNSVVNTGYTLSIGRLFHILKLIKNDLELFDYGKSFKNYLNKYTYLKNILLNDDFYNMLKELIETEVLGKKRHIGNISFEETKKARDILIGKLENKNCIIYTLIKSQSVEF